jgi:hypothetical protein
VRRDVVHACMEKKPLTVYHPNALRSQIWQPIKISANRNSSSVKFDGGMNVIDKRRFRTTQSLSYTGLPLDLRANPGMISDDLKVYRKTLTN